MARWKNAGAALCAAGIGWAAAAPAGAVATDAPAPAGVAQELCDAVAEGLRVLADNRLATPVDGAAKAALLEALIRASEPSATFLDEADLAARSRRLSDREWDVGLTLVAVADGLPIHTANPKHAWEVLGVNSKVQLAELERIAQRKTAEELMESGVRLADPARFDVRGELVCGRDVFIDVNCVFEGEVVLDEAVEVGPNCVIKNARIGAGTRLAAFTHIEDAVVGPDGRIGPFARLRPGTELAEDVHVGNFVEIKKSTIAAHSKANHLAYIGDAIIGSRVNVGAGTITCNYDGANKFQTIIEDDVFIGSDTQLVAPVKVGRGATLGAGTTLTKDAPADTLTISRAKQLSIPGWKRPVKIKK